MLTINLVFILRKSVNYSVSLFSNRNMNSANVYMSHGGTNQPHCIHDNVKHNSKLLFWTLHFTTSSLTTLASKLRLRGIIAHLDDIMTTMTQHSLLYFWLVCS